MLMLDFTCCNIGLSILLLFLFIGLALIIYFITKQKYETRAKTKENNKACKKAHFETLKRNWTDYFWRDYMHFSWIMLFLIFFIALGASLCIYNLFIGLTVIAIFGVITFFFLKFAIKSYQAFPEKAKASLEKFEDEVINGLKNEISFKGDNIQIFSKDDHSFDTEPMLFSFPTVVTRIPFPPLQTNAKKQPIIHKRKLEFLILSREYFSICQGAATFNLLNPDRAGPPKQCAELPGRAGECHEHYYSQMRNVEYDTQNECIRIIYYDERDDVEFPCKKINPDRKPAIKALQEKLRLTERQRLHKIDEHEKYEKILDRRKSSTTDEAYEDEDEEESS
ncbi:MAG: Unknown protein [uncultured Sulfurovum sp.]|uniref:Uncharacterized protein n=1 Tax=uncultured Sulfurovum sp. TaxID=269237 RepID=A0A6S6SYW2_9BACT|nr:MAG: Unknown protein [uncultured Sulfurovum sp.]